MSDRDGILDIHGKCRREREELQAKLAEAERELQVLRNSESLELVKAARVVEAATAWREAESASPYLSVRPEDLDLIAAVDALEVGVGDARNDQ